MLSGRKLDICCVQEVRWRRRGTMTHAHAYFLTNKMFWTHTIPSVFHEQMGIGSQEITIKRYLAVCRLYIWLYIDGKKQMLPLTTSVLHSLGTVGSLSFFQMEFSRLPFQIPLVDHRQNGMWQTHPVGQDPCGISRCGTRFFVP